MWDGVGVWVKCPWTGIIRKRPPNLLSKEKCTMPYDKRIKACMSRYNNGAHSRMQFLTAVSHSMGAHTEALCLTADSSSSDEDETYGALSATTSESSESPATDAAPTDDCREVCLVAPGEGFALVLCGQARFCECCAARGADIESGCLPVCPAPIRMVMCRVLVYGGLHMVAHKCQPFS